ncbi:MAG TPA: hypothetical protein VMP03_03965 [Methylomirabilota bacterium]|nr:hypothetical protein [Methylomirabilota bacterium]
MHVKILLDPSRLRRWHVRLVESLASIPGTTVAVRFVAGPPGDPAAMLLLRLEAIVSGLPAGAPAEPVAIEDLTVAADDGTPADLVLDIVGALNGGGRENGHVLALRCNGAPVDDGALSAVLARAAAVVTLEDAGAVGDPPLSAWRVGVEEEAVAIRAVGTILGRALQLAVLATAAVTEGRPLAALDLATVGPAEIGEAAPRSAGRAWTYARQSVALRIRRRIDRLLKTAPRWSTGLRRAAPFRHGLPDLSAAPFARLSDDGRRFYADPFVTRRDGVAHLFVEEFPFSTGKGVISAATVADDGRVSTPRAVLETDCHLSYPYLLDLDGVMHMIPETSGRQTVELWRAASFPDRWEQRAILLTGVDLSDATVVRVPEGWMMLAASRAWGCSTWDTLDAFFAEDILGPWRPLAGNPVQVDVTSVRPAGAVFGAPGRLIRPVQDCGSRYGAGLAFAAIDRLGPSGVREKIIQRTIPDPPLLGLHSYNRDGGFEVVDVFGKARSASFDLSAGRMEPGTSEP